MIRVYHHTHGESHLHVFAIYWKKGDVEIELPNSPFRLRDDPNFMFGGYDDPIQIDCLVVDEEQWNPRHLEET